MIRTIVFFGAGGLFTACYSNLVRRLPMWRKPSLHVVATAVGLYLGYLGHRFEETSEDRYKEMIKKHKNAKWFPQGQLLAERYAREKAILGGSGEEPDEDEEEEE
ncbi:uncharacterized protein LOC116614363 [Nematostella vectensis]|uniref:uncharacterized protein LOC116614363 n=1 Tax=Nematostella vectensis TaxID=45351 RepID=UPI0020776A4A|nr:uncharacterized protein LOC116614363 [Nematostella vectensis]